MQVFVARQPIFNRRQKVVGYELLFRSGTDNFYDYPDGDRATSTVITNSFLLIGLDALTSGKRAFINFTTNLLVKEVALVLPKDMVGIEVLEDVAPEEKVIEACAKLKQKGYMLVMDDFVYSPEMEPFVALAEMIKVDFFKTKGEERRGIVQRFAGTGIKFLAEKVETQEEFEEALDMGYAYFQGYFFSKPLIMTGRDIPGYKLNYLRILHEVNKPDPNFEVLESIVMQELALSYKLLKLMNSAAFGFHSRISSIRQALVLLGIAEFSKWVSLIALRGIGVDKPDELSISSVIRARMAELLASKVNMAERSSDLFLMGLFSEIDAFLDLPMDQVMNELPIDDDIKEALLGKENRFRYVLDLIISYEHAEWEQFSYYLKKLELAEGDIPDLFLSAVKWAEQILI